MENFEEYTLNLGTFFYSFCVVQLFRMPRGENEKEIKLNLAILDHSVAMYKQEVSSPSKYFYEKRGTVISFFFLNLNFHSFKNFNFPRDGNLQSN